MFGQTSQENSIEKVLRIQVMQPECLSIALNPVSATQHIPPVAAAEKLFLPLVMEIQCIQEKNCSHRLFPCSVALSFDASDHLKSIGLNFRSCKNIVT